MSQNLALPKHKRECPALARVITTTDCGSQRNSKIPCPETCPHNLIADPEKFPDLQERMMQKLGDELITRLGRDRFAGAYKECDPLDMPQLTDEPRIITIMLMLCSLTHVKQDSRTVIRSWQQRGWPGLNNDERVLAECFMKARMTLIEVGNPVDKVISCRDVLDPQHPIYRIANPELMLWPRFTHLLGWVVPYPFSSTLIYYPDDITLEVWPEWKKYFDALVAKARTAQPDVSVHQVLAQNWIELAQFMTSNKSEPEEEGEADEDEDLPSTMEFYLNVPASEVMDLLDHCPEFQRGRSRKDNKMVNYSWVPRQHPNPDLAEESGAHCGDLELCSVKKSGFILVSVNSQEYESAIQTTLFELLGERVTLAEPDDDDEIDDDEIFDEIESKGLTHEVMNELGTLLAPDTSDPQVEADRIRYNEANIALLTNWLNSPSPYFDGRILREAYADPASREEAALIIKLRFKDMQEGSTPFDVDTAAKALGLEELL
jgi:hypothetical protein